MEYEVRKGHYSQIEGEGLKGIMAEEFGKVAEIDGKLASSFGAITKIEVKVVSKTAIEILTETDKTAPADVHAETIKHWNQFLEKATGFTSKERSKRLQKKAKEGKL